jgi:Kelch motif protein
MTFHRFGGFLLLGTIAFGCGRTALTENTESPDSGAMGLLLYGGYDCNTSEELDDTWIWNGSSWTQVDVGGPGPRDSAAAATTRQGFVLLTGGSGAPPPPEPFGAALYGSTLLWEGTAWVTSTSPGPPAREESAMAALNGTCVLFGGRGYNVDTVFDDTWTWDGSNWHEATPTMMPSARYGHSMAALNDNVILFGGITEAYDPDSGFEVGMDVDDTWAWNGEIWIRRLTSGPIARAGAGMATLGDNVILFGGTTDSAYLGDTWAWDGSSWMRLEVNGPDPGQGMAMATFDGTVVLIGGYLGSFDECNCGTDTWIWNGSQWMRLDVPGPTARAYAAMAAFGSANQ